MVKTEGGFLISQIKQVQGRVFEKLLARSGVEAFNGAQGRILYVLWQQDDLPIVELSRRTGLAKTTLTGMLERMELSGLLERGVDKNDKRLNRIRLTDKARELSGVYNEVSAQMNALFYVGFSDAEIEAFEGMLRRVLGNLQEE